MNKEEAINAIYNGRLVECTKEEYSEIRIALQQFAGQRIDQGDGLCAIMALNEVKRLDEKLTAKEL